MIRIVNRNALIPHNRPVLALTNKCIIHEICQNTLKKHTDPVANTRVVRKQAEVVYGG